ncbi:hypothetical protein F5Y09DRAFT_353353 [Xylaria sp. FL1042]|nr:hypothetical protein F5Y09DRAFT_353353 [Xylaria sp. FL1042]
MAYKRPDHLASAFDSKRDTDGPSYDLVSIAQDNRIGYDPQQSSRNGSLPDFTTTLGRVNINYRPILRNYQHAEEKWAELMGGYNVPNTITNDIPDINSEGGALVRSLYDAVYDLSQTLEAPESHQYESITNDNHYPEGVMHVMLWKVLHNIIEAQKGICSLAPWYTPDGPTYKAYPSFAERFRDVELALRVSKACCCSLFSSSDFAARLAWNPTKEYRTSLQSLAIQTCIEQGISRNKDGELEDKNGNKVLGKKKVLTEPAGQKTSGVKKRKRLPKRAKVTSRLTAQAMTQISEQETTPIDNYQDSPPEAHRTSTTSAEYGDNIDLSPSEIYRGRNDNTVIFSKDAGGKGQSGFDSLSRSGPQEYLNTQRPPNLQSDQFSQPVQQLQASRPPQISHQLQPPQQQEVTQQMPIPYYAQFQSHGFVDPGYGTLSNTPQTNAGQYRFPHWPKNTGFTDNPWSIPIIPNLISGDALAQQEQQSENRDQNEGHPYNGGQVDNHPNNLWDPDIFWP